MNTIICPENKGTDECIKFWERAGYKLGVDFAVIYTQPAQLKAKTQMILAQDAIKFGFRAK